MVKFLKNLPLSQQEHLQIFSTSPCKSCALSFNFALESDPKNIFYYQCDVENCTDQVLDFLLFDSHEYIIHRNLPVCDSDQYIYVTGLHNVFFALQDLIDRINSYFNRIAFQRNLLLIGFKIFPMKITRHQWNGAAQTCKEKLWRKVASEYQISKSLFF